MSENSKPELNDCPGEPDRHTKQKIKRVILMKKQKKYLKRQKKLE